jgi:hypothetical protein
MVTSSTDKPVLLLCIVVNTRSCKFARYTSEYVSMGFQRTPEAVLELCCRPRAAAVVMTLAFDQVIKFLLFRDRLGASTAEVETETFSIWPSRRVSWRHRLSVGGS